MCKIKYDSIIPATKNVACMHRNGKENTINETIEQNQMQIYNVFQNAFSSICEPQMSDHLDKNENLYRKTWNIVKKKYLRN